MPPKVFGCVAYSHVLDSEMKVRPESSEVTVRWLQQKIERLQTL